MFAVFNYYDKKKFRLTPGTSKCTNIIVNMYCHRDIVDWVICASLIQLPELEMEDVKYKQ